MHKSLLILIIAMVFNLCGTGQNSISLNCASGDKIGIAQLTTCSKVEIKGMPDATIKVFELSCTTSNGLTSVLIHGAALSEPAVNLLRSLKAGNKIFIEGIIATGSDGKKLKVKNAKFIVQ